MRNVKIYSNVKKQKKIKSISIPLITCISFNIIALMLTLLLIISDLSRADYTYVLFYSVVIVLSLSNVYLCIRSSKVTKITNIESTIVDIVKPIKDRLEEYQKNTNNVYQMLIDKIHALEFSNHRNASQKEEKVVQSEPKVQKSPEPSWKKWNGA